MLNHLLSLSSHPISWFCIEIKGFAISFAPAVHSQDQCTEDPALVPKAFMLQEDSKSTLSSNDCKSLPFECAVFILIYICKH